MRSPRFQLKPITLSALVHQYVEAVAAATDEMTLSLPSVLSWSVSVHQFTVPICSLTLYNNVVARCFEDCVSEFRRRELDLGEEKVRFVMLAQTLN